MARLDTERAPSVVRELHLRLDDISRRIAALYSVRCGTQAFGGDKIHVAVNKIVEDIRRKRLDFDIHRRASALHICDDVLSHGD